MRFYKFSYLTVFLISFIINGCAIEDNSIITKEFELENFNLTQLDTNGIELFRLVSSKATIESETNNIKANNVNISLSGDQKIFDSISSEKCLLDKKSNTLFLRDKVTFTTTSNSDSYLIADNLAWHIDKSLVYLSGNIYLKYLKTELLSDKASYNDNLKQIIFDGINKYTVYNELKQTNPLIKLDSDTAIIDYKSKSIRFQSNSRQVKSIVNLDN